MVVRSLVPLSPRKLSPKRSVLSSAQAIELYDRAFHRRATDGRPVKGEGYDELIKIIAARTGEAPASLAVALPYFDREARLKVEDIAEQIEVYQALRLVAPALKVDAVLDRSFVPSGRK